jgi:hypothetical protein
MARIVIYFTASTPPPFEPFIDPYNYFFKGQEFSVPPNSLVICIPCQNTDYNHSHNLHNCKLMTYARGWDVVQPNDYVTVYVLDHEHDNNSLILENGELLATFLTYNQEYYGAEVNKCITPVINLCPPLIEYQEDFDLDYDNDEDDDDDGYESNMSM